MTQPNGEFEDAQAHPAIKMVGVLELMGAIKHLSDVVYAFVNSDIITREGSQRLDEETAAYFMKVHDIIGMEKDIIRTRKE